MLQLACTALCLVFLQRACIVRHQGHGSGVTFSGTCLQWLEATRASDPPPCSFAAFSFRVVLIWRYESAREW